MQDRKNRTTREKCDLQEAENTKDKSSSKRDKELGSLREKKQKDNELQKDAFDIAVELSGLGI
jgi:hypothetical protein